MVPLAHVISLVFDPIITSTLALFLIISSAEKDLNRVVLWFGLVFLVGMLPPLIFLVIEKKRGRVTDWFLYNRKERVPIYVATLISLSITLFLIWKLEGPQILLVYSLASLLNSLILALATFLGHKPSVHASAVTFLVLVLISLISIHYWPALLLIPVVAWSRAKLGKHTWPQLFAGVTITLVVVLTTLKLFAFI